MQLKIKLSILLLFNSALIGNGHQAFAAACCGGGFAAPALIVGDDRAQITSSYHYSVITDDVGVDQLWRSRTARETSESFKIEAAHLLADRWQAGFSVPLIRRSRSGDQSTGLGDITGTLGYELVPDWDYHPWRPKVLAFLQVITPTGRAIQDAHTSQLLDARGRGFWALGIGTIFTKTLGSWDVFANADVHHSFARDYRNDQASGTLSPGLGGNLGFGLGYSLQSLRVGSSLTWTFEGAVDLDGTIASQGSAQRYATFSLTASYLFPKEWAATLSYANQTWFGSPVNTSLGQGATLLLQKRWLR